MVAGYHGGNIMGLCYGGYSSSRGRRETERLAGRGQGQDVPRTHPQ